MKAPTRTPRISRASARCALSCRSRLDGWRITLTAVILPALALACTLSIPTPQPTPAAPTAAATAGPLTEPPTATALPTDTPTAAPTDTPTPDPTAGAETQAAETQSAAAALIEPDLRRYGLSASQGSLGWMHEPVTINLTNYGEYQIKVDYPDLTVADFVVQADVTWSTTTGLAGCGFAVRAARGFGRRLEYELFTIRLSGAPLWGLVLFKGGVGQSLVGFRDAPTLSVELDSTNTVALVAEGASFTTYINGVSAGAAHNSEVREGAVGFLATQESGRTTCSFENAWLWVLRPGSGVQAS